MFVNMDASSNVEFNDNHNSNTVMVGYQKKQFIWSETGPSGFSSLPASIHGVKSPTNEEGTAHREEKRVSQWAELVMPEK